MCNLKDSFYKYSECLGIFKTCKIQLRPHKLLTAQEGETEAAWHWKIAEWADVLRSVLVYSVWFIYNLREAIEGEKRGRKQVEKVGEWGTERGGEKEGDGGWG